MPNSSLRQANPATVKRLLLVKLSSLGDIVHALPLMEALREGLGSDTFIGWAVRSKFADILTGNPHISQTFVLKGSNAPEILDFGARLRREHFDTTLDAQGLLVSGIVTGLSGAPHRIGLDSNREGNRLFLTSATVPATQRIHIVDKLLGFCDVLGIPRPPLKRQTYLVQGETSLASELLASSGNGPIVGCIVGASTPEKTYPMDQWSAVIRALSSQGLRPILLGGEGEKLTANQIVTTCGGAVAANLTGKTPLRVLASVLAKCDIVIGGDSGPTHLAVAVGTPVVGLYGVTDPVRTGTNWGVSPSIILDYAEKDAPPATRRARHPTLTDSLARIPPEAVFDAVQQLICQKS